MKNTNKISKNLIFLSMGFLLYVSCVRDYCPENFYGKKDFCKIGCCRTSLSQADLSAQDFCMTGRCETFCDALGCNVKELCDQSLCEKDYEKNVAKDIAKNCDMCELNFDKIFPETNLRKIFDLCAKIYQELVVVNSRFFYDLDFFTDLLVGKLFNIKMLISKIPAYHQEDIIYLDKIFDKILLKYQEKCDLCPEFVSNPKRDNVQEIIREIMALF